VPEGVDRGANRGLALNQGVWRIAALALLLATAFTYFAWLGDMPLSDRDEGEYAASVAAMIRSGDYLVPTLNGEHYLEKPILLFWSIAASFRAWGPGEFAARFPSALSAFLLVLLTGLLVWRVSGSLAPATLAAGALAFSPLLVLVGRACLTDALLTLFTTFSLAAFFLAQEAEPPGERFWYLAAWAGLGLGFLTKGPVAAAVVLPAALIYAIWQGRLGRALKGSHLLWGLLVFTLINLPWYGLAFYELGGEFWRSFFLDQNLRRFGEVLLGHGGNLAYYLPVLFFGAFPFSAAALPALVRALGKNPALARRADPLARLRLLAAISLLWTVIVFSLAATKQINYILPALPFAAILAGYFLWRLGAGEAPGRAARIIFWGFLAFGAVVWFLALAGVPLGIKIFWSDLQAAIRPDSSEYALPAQAPLMIFWPLATALAGAAFLALAWWLERQQMRAWLGLGLVGAGLVFCTCMGMGLLPSAAAVVQEPAREMALALKARVGEDVQVLSYGLWKPSLLYYLDRDIPSLETKDKLRLARLLSTREPVLVLTRLRLGKKLRSMSAFQAIAPFSGYLLGGNRAARALWQGTVPSGEAQR